jgi:hypothetical protein
LLTTEQFSSVDTRRTVFRPTALGTVAALDGDRPR